MLGRAPVLLPMIGAGKRPNKEKGALWGAFSCSESRVRGSVADGNRHRLGLLLGRGLCLCLRPSHQAGGNVLVDLDEEIELLHIRLEQDAHALVDDETAKTNHVLAQLWRQGAIFLCGGGQKDCPQLAIVGERLFNHADGRVPVLLECLELRGCLEQGAGFKLALT